MGVAAESGFPVTIVECGRFPDSAEQPALFDLILLRDFLELREILLDQQVLDAGTV